MSQLTNEGHRAANAESLAAIPSRPPDRPVPRVAVVGVHGVGAHAADASENAMANLLFSLPAGHSSAHRFFGSFRAVGVQVPLQPVRVAQRLGEPRKGLLTRALDLYQEQSAKFAELAADYGKTVKQVERGKAGNAYTQLLLQDYQGGADGDVYVTTRLEGKRHAGAPGGEAEVHVYEVLWADLARPDNTVLNFLMALFQLVLHLGSLSRLAIDTGSAENTGLLWKVYLAAQRYAVRLLQIFIPLAKVTLLIVIFSCIPALLSYTHDRIWLPIVLFCAAGIVAGFFLFSRVHKPASMKPWIWALLALLPAAVGAAAGFWVSMHASSPDVASSVACWLFLGGPLLFYVLRNYEGVRKGVEITGGLVYGVFFLVFACYAYSASVPQSTFWTAEWVIAAIRASWMLLFVCALLALVLGSLAWRLHKDQARRARARAAVRTSRLALALPAVLFLLITSMIWAGMFKIARAVHHPFFGSAEISQPPGGAWLQTHHLIPNPGCTPVNGDYFPGAVAWSVGYQLPVTLAFFGLALFLLAWWALPAAITERFPLRGKNEPPRSSTNAQSVRMGAWNSRGLDATSVVTFLFWCAIFVAPPAFYFWPENWPAFFRCSTIQIVQSWAGVATAAALATVVKYGSEILRAVLDVDTYLRTSPPDATPRAKIMERYVSTLRFLAQYRNADGRGYDSVVIVAHSLGALISADLLRFLYAEGDPELAAFGLSRDHKLATVPITLLTMGNPTRQLLNRFMPYLYDWVRDEPDNGLKPLPSPDLNPPDAIPADALPDPEELGVARWLNTYRSGDYIGRSVWLQEWYCRTSGPPEQGRYPEAIHQVRGGRRTEMCIGAGAHTHYWDDTAPDVAQLLNSLI